MLPVAELYSVSGAIDPDRCTVEYTRTSVHTRSVFHRLSVIDTANVPWRMSTFAKNLSKRSAPNERVRLDI